MGNVIGEPGRVRWRPEKIGRYLAKKMGKIRGCTTFVITEHARRG
jgi:hypothetical protein